MATYATLCVISDAELTQFFPGWRYPLASQIERQGRNPFTGETLTFKVWDSGRTESADSPKSLANSYGRPTIPPVFLPDDDYSMLLESNAPPLLRTFPHFAMKGITGLELATLSEARLGRELPPARFVALADEEGALDAMSSEGVETLANARDDQLNDVAEKWQSASDGDYSIFPSIDEAQWALARVAALARIAKQSSAYLYTHFNA
jgi:hypothetical protein